MLKAWKSGDSGEYSGSGSSSSGEDDQGGAFLTRLKTYNYCSPLG